MQRKPSEAVVCNGTINTAMIYDTHRQIKEIVESYKEVNIKVAKITAEVNENWVGKGHNEFQSQYNLLIKKIDDFGDTLQEIYDALVEAETSYEDTDDDIRQDFVMSMQDSSGGAFVQGAQGAQGAAVGGAFIQGAQGALGNA